MPFLCTPLLIVLITLDWNDLFIVLFIMVVPSSITVSGTWWMLSEGCWINKWKKIHFYEAFPTSPSQNKLLFLCFIALFTDLYSKLSHVITICVLDVFPHNVSYFQGQGINLIYLCIFPGTYFLPYLYKVDLNKCLLNWIEFLCPLAPLPHN